MFELKNFDNWNIDTETQFGSGASEKMWLINPETNKSGLFKFPKTKTDGNMLNYNGRLFNITVNTYLS